VRSLSRLPLPSALLSLCRFFCSSRSRNGAFSFSPSLSLSLFASASLLAKFVANPINSYATICAPGQRDRSRRTSPRVISSSRFFVQRTSKGIGADLQTSCSRALRVRRTTRGRINVSPPTAFRNRPACGLEIYETRRDRQFISISRRSSPKTDDCVIIGNRAVIQPCSQRLRRRRTISRGCGLINN